MQNQATTMNHEQIEAHLASYAGKGVCVTVPIRGTCSLSYFGTLLIKHDPVADRPYYYIDYMPDCMLSFQVSDVYRVTDAPNPEWAALIMIKPTTESYAFSPP